MFNNTLDIEKKAIQVKDEAIKRAARLKKVELSEYSGWKDFIELLDDYTKKMMHNKSITNLSTAKEETLEMLKLYDRDIWLINNVIKKIPMLFVRRLEEQLKRDAGKSNAEVAA